MAMFRVITPVLDGWCKITTGSMYSGAINGLPSLRFIELPLVNSISNPKDKFPNLKYQITSIPEI